MPGVQSMLKLSNHSDSLHSHMPKCFYGFTSKASKKATIIKHFNTYIIFVKNSPGRDWETRVINILESIMAVQSYKKGEICSLVRLMLGQQKQL